MPGWDALFNSERTEIVNKKNKEQMLSRIILSFWMLLILMSLFVTASYTWFSISRTPTVSEMAMARGVELQDGMIYYSFY